jgi:hypothetical protein
MVRNVAIVCSCGARRLSIDHGVFRGQLAVASTHSRRGDSAYLAARVRLGLLALDRCSFKPVRLRRRARTEMFGCYSEMYLFDKLWNDVNEFIEETF